MKDKNYGHIGINTWLSLEEFARLVRVCRSLGSTSTKPGQLIRQYVQGTTKSIESALQLEPIKADTAQLVSLLRDHFNIKSVQLNPLKFRRNMLEAISADSIEDAEFKNWKRRQQATTDDDELEQLIEENMDRPLVDEK
jgi:hypothetical protein